ncbi:expansin module family protein [Coniella lustricola]|uniref:Expansin module family protein n=1 Tax=Coniella lustricola TaxID=2025994 RepID=A0A2T3AD82_9PEZI|nr:expansin module family protein [Coniella lustricola]
MYSHTKVLFVLQGLASLVQVSKQQGTCAVLYAQCGGEGWTGATCCETGSSCYVTNSYYSQCLPASEVSTLTSGSSGATTTAATSVSSYTGPADYTTTDATATVASHAQSAYPSVDASSCGDWTLVDNVCCPLYCSNQNESSSCDSTCTGECITPPSEDCMSGTMWGETFHVNSSEEWHYSRSTHFGETSGGACGFGLYGLCTNTNTSEAWVAETLGDTCEAFCLAYPSLCQDPTAVNLTMRGNFAAPNGDYYTQFWPNLPGELDNYLSCGECFQLIHTKDDGTDYAVGEEGYTDPILLEIVDSCPCDANPKWCCGSGADHCGEVSDFTYGCPIPEDSHHMDLSDVAMGRLQGNGSLTDGVIPIRYQRVPCPKPGNVYLWLQVGAGPYYFALSPVNTNGPGSVISFEVLGSGDSEWLALERNSDYTSSRPQERYGAWVMPQGSGPVNPPIAVRLTSPTGEQIVNMDAITSFTAPANADANYYYIDMGVQFAEN